MKGCTYIKLNYNQERMLRVRGLNPKDWVFVRESYVSLYVRNIHNGQIKVINKQN